jgi:hypothetical protein
MAVSRYVQMTATNGMTFATYLKINPNLLLGVHGLCHMAGVTSHMPSFLTATSASHTDPPFKLLR